MKRIFFLIISLLATFTPCHSQKTVDSLWDQANTAYINADYLKAAVLYDSIIATGNVSYKLYFNLGNAYFKEGRVGESILNYNRALKLAPSNEDVKYNLAIANSHVKDKIESIPEFILTTWVKSVRLSMSSNTWAVVSLVMLGLALGLVLLYLLSQNISARKSGFYGAIMSLIICLIAMVFSSIERNELLNSSEAIIMRTAAPVKSSPDNASKDIFILHEGTKVEIVSTLNGWSEVMIADGNKGWIMSGSIENI